MAPVSVPLCSKAIPGRTVNYLRMIQQRNQRDMSCQMLAASASQLQYRISIGTLGNPSQDIGRGALLLGGGIPLNPISLASNPESRANAEIPPIVSYSNSVPRPATIPPGFEQTVKSRFFC